MRNDKYKRYEVRHQPDRNTPGAKKQTAWVQAQAEKFNAKREKQRKKR